MTTNNNETWGLHGPNCTCGQTVFCSACGVQILESASMCANCIDALPELPARFYCGICVGKHMLCHATAYAMRVGDEEASTRIIRVEDDYRKSRKVRLN